MVFNCVLHHDRKHTVNSGHCGTHAQVQTMQQRIQRRQVRQCDRSDESIGLKRELSLLQSHSPTLVLCVNSRVSLKMGKQC